MKNLKKILGINLVIMLVYNLIVMGLFFAGASSSDGYASLAILIILMYVVGFHVTVVLIISIARFVKRDMDMGKAHLLAALVILIVGFSSCWGNAALFGGMGF